MARKKAATKTPAKAEATQITMTVAGAEKPAIEPSTAGEAGDLDSNSGANFMKKKAFVDQVVLRSGLKRRDVKAAVDATLDTLSAALTDGQDLNLPPLGKIKVVKAKAVGDGAQAITLKLRTRGTPSELHKTDLAAPFDED